MKACYLKMRFAHHPPARPREPLSSQAGIHIKMKVLEIYWSVMPDKFPNWVSLLEDAGYLTGKNQKGWAPGDFKRGGYEHNPAGKDSPSFEAFLEERKPGQPFSYWFGSTDPHRNYETNTGVKNRHEI